MGIQLYIAYKLVSCNIGLQYPFTLMRTAPRAPPSSAFLLLNQWRVDAFCALCATRSFGLVAYLYCSPPLPVMVIVPEHIVIRST